MRLVDRAAEVKGIIEREPGVRAAEIAERTGVSKATLTRVIRTLVDADEIQRKRDSSGRGLGLHSTQLALRRRLISRQWNDL